MNSIKLNLKRHQGRQAGRQAGIQKERAVETIILFVPDIHFLFLIWTSSFFKFKIQSLLHNEIHEVWRADVSFVFVFFLFFLFLFFFHFFSTEKSFESGPESEFILKMNKEKLQTFVSKGRGDQKRRRRSGRKRKDFVSRVLTRYFCGLRLFVSLISEKYRVST